jgi:hypothetical protein
MRTVLMRPHRVLLLALLAVLGLSAACKQMGIAVGGTAEPLTVADVVADPQRYLGKTVSLDGGVARVVGEGVLSLQSDAAEQDLLAIVGNNALLGIDSIQPGETLRMVGTVQALTREDLVKASSDLGIKLDTDMLLNLGGKGPFIVVQTLAKAK